MEITFGFGSYIWAKNPLIFLKCTIS